MSHLQDHSRSPGLKKSGNKTRKSPPKIQEPQAVLGSRSQAHSPSAPRNSPTFPVVATPLTPSHLFSPAPLRNFASNQLLEDDSIFEIKSDDGGVFRFPTPVMNSSPKFAAATVPPKLNISSALKSEQTAFPYSPSEELDFLAALSNADNRPIGEDPHRKWPTRSNTTTESPNQPKLSRWRSLGGLFSRRPSVRASNSSPSASTTTSAAATPVLGASKTGNKLTRARSTPNPAAKSSSSSSQPIFRKASRRRSKVRLPEIPPPPPPKDYVLEVDIPQSEMERYSIMFKDIRGLPGKTRASFTTNRPPRRMTNPLPQPGLVRRATDPLSPSSTRAIISPRSPPLQINTSAPRNEPYIAPFPPFSQTRQLRSNTAPSLRTPYMFTATSHPKPPLSPAFEVDENYKDQDPISPPPFERGPPSYGSSHQTSNASSEALAFDQGRTPSPTTAPATPKSMGISPHLHQDPWDINPSLDWDYITIGKRYSPGDTFTLPGSITVTPVVSRPGTRDQPSRSNSTDPTVVQKIHHALSQSISSTPSVSYRPSPNLSIQQSNPPTPVIGSTQEPESAPVAAADDDEDWVCEAPQVVVARSVSVTRANSKRLVVRPVRSSSRAGSQGTGPRSASTSTSASTSSTSTPRRRSVTAGATQSMEEQRAARLLARREELRREIWGSSRSDPSFVSGKTAVQMDVTIVEGVEERKSVLGVIESA